MAVLSHLALRFSSHPENLATEALAYILQRSASARTGLNRIVQTLSGKDLALERFETQSSHEDLSRPDLCGLDADGNRSLLIEVKFWAGLTEAQPNGYLSAMRHPGVLLFVAPEARLTSLWHELTRRIAERQAPTGATNDGAFTIVTGDHILAAVSWRSLLLLLEQETAAAAEAETAADVRQLQALCEHMDTDAFLPLSSEELTSSLGRRVVQFEALSNDLTDALVRLGLADVSGLRATAGWGYAGRYLYLKGNGAFLAFNANNWSAFGQSPLWLDISGDSWKRTTPSPAIKQALHAAGIQYWEQQRLVSVPIILPSAVERDGVVASAQRQLLRIIDALPEIVRGAPPKPEPDAP